jgi:hypothetical protein
VDRSRRRPTEARCVHVNAKASRRMQPSGRTIAMSPTRSRDANSRKNKCSRADGGQHDARVGESGRLPQPGSSQIRTISLPPKRSGRNVVPARGSRDSGLRWVDAVRESLGREQWPRSCTHVGLDSTGPRSTDCGTRWDGPMRHESELLSLARDPACLSRGGAKHRLERTPCPRLARNSHGSALLVASYEQFEACSPDGIGAARYNLRIDEGNVTTEYR